MSPSPRNRAPRRRQGLMVAISPKTPRAAMPGGGRASPEGWSSRPALAEAGCGTRTSRLSPGEMTGHLASTTRAWLRRRPRRQPRAPSRR
eukprot:1484198-Pyramimonas_sp.AAC.1